MGVKIIKLKDIYKMNTEPSTFNDDKTRMGIEGVIKKIGKYTVIFFKGSNHSFDWLINLFAVHKNGFHAGWFEETRSFYISFDSYVVKKAILDSEDIIIAGYSKGSASAKIFLSFCTFLDGKNIQFIEFGAPNYAKSKIVKRFRDTFPNLSFKNGGDIVTTIPIFLSGLPKKQIGKRKLFPSFKDHLGYKDNLGDSVCVID